jgi:lipoprotein-anchoring transpeptidase ErfK/SrfK
MNRHHSPIRAGRRWLVMLLAALTVVGGLGMFTPSSATAGMAGTVVVDGAPLYADWDDYTVIDWMSAGVTVDHFWGPHEGLYEIRYQGTVGWTPVENVDFGGGSAAAAPAVADTSTSGEHWIDVNRSDGAIRLYIGDEVQYVAYGVLSQSQGEDYYATASGTYYIYSMNRSLTYTPFAEAYITHWIGFDAERRNGFHSWTKDANGNIRKANGDAYTWGCVAMAPGDDDVIFDFAEYGMRVEVHW